MDKSGSNQGTETEDTEKSLNKLRSISSASFLNKSTKKQIPKEIYIKKTNQVFLVCLDMEQVYRVNHQINNVFLEGIKERILQTLRSKENKVFKYQTTQVKGQKRILYLM